MNTITFIVIVGIMLAIRELIIGIYVWHSRRIFRHIYRIENTQRHFAVARNALMQLAMENKINVNSESFKRFYFFNTGLMRRPDQYPEFSSALTQTFLSPPNSEPSEELTREIREWTPEFKEVVKATANAMDYIVLDYSLIVQFMFWIDRRIIPDSTPTRMLRRAGIAAEKKALSNIRKAQQVMYRMAETTP